MFISLLCAFVFLSYFLCLFLFLIYPSILLSSSCSLSPLKSSRTESVFLDSEDLISCYPSWSWRSFRRFSMQCLSIFAVYCIWTPLFWSTFQCCRSIWWNSDRRQHVILTSIIFISSFPHFLCFFSLSMQYQRVFLRAVHDDKAMFGIHQEIVWSMSLSTTLTCSENTFFTLRSVYFIVWSPFLVHVCSLSLSFSLSLSH